MKRRVLLTLILAGCWHTVVARHLTICFEAESAEIVEAPMVVASNGVTGASGEWLEIPEGAGNPPKVQAGKAVIIFETPREAEFFLWCRVWWNDECGNSFEVQLNDQPKFLLGEDNTYECWHWVKHPVVRTAKPIRLAAGNHTITFFNREDGVRLDQVLLTTNRRFVPVDIEKTGVHQ